MSQGPRRNGRRIGGVFLATLSAAALGLALAEPARARGPSTRPEPTPADGLSVFLVTLGPGAAVWERFGHNALRIRDPARGTDIAYHYGLFDPGSRGFILEFIRGRMLYSMGSAPADPFIDSYRRAGRNVTIQRLRVPEERIRRLERFLRWNLRPENRVYRYHYFLDNCSTRVRDALDAALDGQLRSVLARRSTPSSYRSEAVALTAGAPLLSTGIDLALGPRADERLSEWQRAFVPIRLRESVRTVRVRQGGVSVPLVASETHLPAIGALDLAVRDSSTDGHQRAWLPFLFVGLAIGGGLGLAGWMAGRRSSSGIQAIGRWVFVLGAGVWGLAAGLLGLILLGLWTLTDHEFAWRNLNLLQVNPLALGLVLLAPLAVFGRRADRWARWVAAALAGLSLLGLVAQLLPTTDQANLPSVALVLPVHIGLLVGLLRAGNSQHTTPMNLVERFSGGRE